MVKQLIERKYLGKIVKFINKWLGGSVTKFILGEELSKEKTVWQGVPQGGILSPLLYVIYTKNLGKVMDKELQMLQYADDIIIYNMGNGRKEQKKKLEEGIKVLGKRLRELNLDIEPKKTQFMVFGVKGKENRKERSIIVEGEEIRNKREARFLGLLMNEKLN